ncbi:protein SPT2 homolog [Coccinella septempunctata]|uniref:protein SPT2 homolog n=1 Tax=Coccinella septempunctata TaxID=41139 RepID=UPI001D0877CF|nr:protein SPT2 homolog [Coccinella septempunctata]
MDFGTLLYNAQKNKEVMKEPIKYYSTKFAPPKKEQKDKSRLSVNVRKFLEKKEEEERQKRLEVQRKKEELLALRSKDKKAVKRVNVMLKRTKSANQSVIQDAEDSDNTAVTLVGLAQPDEDDYGYVSQEASAFYNKMMEKYSKMPDKTPKFLLEKKKVNTNLSSTKDRVKAALEKEKEEAMMPHRRKRKHKNPEDISSPDDNFPSTPSRMADERPDAKKPKIDKPKMPPPMNFNELLKLAEKKQFEPIVIEKKSKEDESPLTKKQKREMERMRVWQERKPERLKPDPSEPKQKINKEAETAKSKIAKVPNQSILATARTSSNKADNKMQNPEPEIRKKIDWGPKHPSAGRMNIITKAPVDTKKPVPSASNNPMKDLGKSVSNYTEKSIKIATKSNNGTTKNSLPSKDIKRHPKEISVNSRGPSDKKMLDKTKEKEMLQRELSKPKKFPPNDLRHKHFPPADVRRKPMSNKIKMQMKKRRIIDDDDEDYDSEMDDFIDDGPEEEEEDYSKYIREIFGYNKSKYVEVDEEDDDIMESSFSQQMKEEQISTKLGIMEDLEDMRLEEEHKRRKALMKKKFDS